MNIDTSVTDTLYITGAPALDPITVFLQDFGGKGRITVECLGRVWTTYFGNFGTGSLTAFVGSAETSYLVNRFLPREIISSQKVEKGEAAYLTRIVTALREALLREVLK